jgi:hypothetical protein
MVMILAIAVALTLVATSARPALGLTNGQAVNTAFPRVSMWWPNGSAPSADLAKLDYLVPYEWQPMQPDTARLATLRALNPSQALFADASTCELNYRQPDSAGNPSGSASYDTERIGAIPTSWILTQVGSTLSASITTVTRPQQSITVADGTKFRAGNLVVIDDEKCLVVSVSGSTLVVRRGWAGSAAVNHSAGTRIAAAVSAWPYSVKVDLTDECPLGRATGEIATPGTGTERGRDWMVRRTASHYAAGNFDGVAIDLGIGYISWFKGTDIYSYLSIASRSNLNAEVDYTAYDAKWAAALNTFQSSLRAAVGPDAVILVNEATPAFAALNGARIEDFPQKTSTTTNWYQKIIGPNKTYFPSYLEWCASARQPNFTTLQTYGDAPTDYQLMRFGLTSALMGDGFYAFKVGNTNQVLRYDEYDNAGAGKGYLGKPLGAMRSVVTLSTTDLVGGTGSFADAASLNAWTLYPRAGYASSKVLDGGTAKLAVTQSAGSVDGVELTRSNVGVVAGTTYTLTFRARADRPLNIQAVAMRASSPWTDYMSTPETPLTTEWRTFEIPMTASGSDAAAILKFTLGQSVGTIWLDDVKLQAGNRNAYRRDFEGGVALVNATDAAVTVNLDGSFRKIKGTQAPSVNDGTLVTAVTIPAKDGLVLVRPALAPGAPPVANADAYSTRNATALSVSAPGLLGNDDHASGTTLSASIVTQPAHGTLSLGADGSFTYTPASDFTGSDSFGYRAYDGTTYSATAAVAITVAAPVVADPVAPPAPETPVVTTPVPATPTVINKPVVRRTNKSHGRTTYSFSGSVQLGSVATVSSAAYSVAAASTQPVVEVQIERYVRKHWRVYKKVRAFNASSRYTTRAQLRSGKYRARTLVSGGSVPAARSTASKTFKVR